MSLRITLLAVTTTLASIDVGITCDLSVRDQVLLIRAAEVTPPAGGVKVANLAGAGVECAVRGPFRVVRSQDAGLYVLDPGRVFQRWGQTGMSFTGGRYRALRVYFDGYTRTGLMDLWQEFGRGVLTEDEKMAMSVDVDTSLAWRQIRLLDPKRYQTLLKERPSAEVEQVIRSLLIASAREYMIANRPKDYIIKVVPSTILKYAPDTAVTVTYKQRSGAVRTLTVRVPTNPEMPPYVGYAFGEQAAIQSVHPPLIGGDPHRN